MECPHCKYPAAVRGSKCPSCHAHWFSLSAGDTLAGIYEIVAPLGRGGNAEVFEARHLRTQMRLALKVAHGPNQDEARLFRELAIGQSIDHPNVVRVFDCREGNPPFLVMELVRGTTLRDWLLADPVVGEPSPVRYRMIHDTLRAVGAFHSKLAIHGDLNSSNFILSEEGQLKLIDLGTAKRLLNGTDFQTAQQGDLVGTPEYMAPELLKTLRQSLESDVYALGALAFEILTGGPVFAGDRVQVVSQHANASIPEARLGHCHESVRRVICQALAKSPQERFANAMEFAAALEQVSRPTAAVGAVHDPVPLVVRTPGPPSKEGPFGSPEGSGAGIYSVLADFVDLGDRARWHDLATAPNELEARVFAGRKGSGKTVYLRRLWAYARTSPILFADQWEHDHPKTSLVGQFSEGRPVEELVEDWRGVWQMAILLHVASQLTRSRKTIQLSLETEKLKNGGQCDEPNRTLQDYVNAPSRRELLECLARFGDLTSGKEVRTVYNLVSNLLELEFFDKSKRVALWRPYEDLVAILTRVLHSCPPVCVFLDGTDDVFEKDPRSWLACQRGLLDAILGFLPSEQLGNRLHVFITVKDIALNALLNTENLGKTRDVPAIRRLEWSRSAFQHLLEMKIQRLPDEWLASPEAATPIVRWLGHEVIWNKKRSEQEPLKDYLWRHTFSLPRDLVHLGNALSDAVRRHKRRLLPGTLEDEIRRVVSVQAASFAREQLQICANYLVARGLPEKSHEYETSTYYVDDEGYCQEQREVVERIIRSIGQEVFSEAELEEAEKKGTELLLSPGGLPDTRTGRRAPGTMLLRFWWQLGIVGFLDTNARRQFMGRDDHHEFDLPRGMHRYVFHPSMIDHLGIASVGKVVQYG